MQTFATTAPITTVVDIPAGRVQLIAAERADATVEVRPADAGKSRDVKIAEQTTVSYADGVLRIEAKGKNQILGSSGSLEITVQLPAGSAVQVKAASADFRAVGRFGDITLDGAHGPAKIDEATGVQVTTQAGDIAIGRLNGPAEITTAQGDITIAEAHRGALTLTTQAGNITVDAAAGVSATLDAGTTVGRINNTLKNADSSPELTIRATTTQGDITARSL
ncbi:hypothetical protein BWI15_36305 [Kribbella sp. ALI-6-A]|uniref:DUF4097 family beta strand repeat-containing protein n=1 Tax=Kribbella sp. ALI-6-A TaxID=1933817 RepID=UPI00097C724E|nr:DUF4097 family beta strand repeat-containing protein [Kribbella sp. ALI-6-A]ONI68459.1 hypothetical protein BWI15_36305 [Kribbella sp. ALI-6-A]